MFSLIKWRIILMHRTRIYLHDELHGQLKRRAISTGVSMSELIRQTLENFLAGPSGAAFTQINRGQAVRLSAVRSYRGSAASGLRLCLAGGKEVTVSRRRAPEVSSALRAAGHAPAKEG
jgi:hypothetical protein